MLSIRPEQLEALRNATVSAFIRRIAAELQRDEVVSQIAPELVRAAIEEERGRAAMYGFIAGADAEEYIVISVRSRFRERPPLAELQAIFSATGAGAGEKLVAARALAAQAAQ